jgi:hypothetical protein
MTLGGKKYDTSSKLNNTPPMGAPNATATPAAEAALKISRLLPRRRLLNLPKGVDTTKERTFVRLVLDKEATDDVPDAARDVYKRTLLAYKRISVGRVPASNVHTYLTTTPKQQRGQDPQL